MSRGVINLPLPSPYLKVHICFAPSHCGCLSSPLQARVSVTPRGPTHSYHHAPTIFLWSKLPTLLAVTQQNVCTRLSSFTDVRSCLQFVKAAQHAFRKEARHSSMCHGHLGARDNEGTLFQPSGLLLTAAEPTPALRGGEQHCSWGQPALQCGDTAHSFEAWVLQDRCFPGFCIQLCTGVSEKQSACRYGTHLILN